MNIAKIALSVLKSPQFISFVTSPKVRGFVVDVVMTRQLRKLGVDYVLDATLDGDVLMLRGEVIGRLLLNNEIILFADEDAPNIVPEITLFGAKARYVLKKLTYNTSVGKITST